MSRPKRVVNLTDSERQELEKLRDTAPKAYVRERAAAILKVADGTPGSHVAYSGLLKRRMPETVYIWLNRYRDRGIEGLYILPGRGRKPAFSPCVQ